MKLLISEIDGFAKKSLAIVSNAYLQTNSPDTSWNDIIWSSMEFCRTCRAHNLSLLLDLPDSRFLSVRFITTVTPSIFYFPDSTIHRTADRFLSTENIAVLETVDAEWKNPWVKLKTTIFGDQSSLKSIHDTHRVIYSKKLFLLSYKVQVHVHLKSTSSLYFVDPQLVFMLVTSPTWNLSEYATYSRIAYS